MGRDTSPEHVNSVVNQIAPPESEADSAAVSDNFPRMTYFSEDTLVADPGAAIGRVFVERGGGPVLERFLLDVNVQPDETSKLTSPVVRAEILMTKKAAAELSALSVLNLEGSGEDVYEFRVVDNYAANVRTGTEAFAEALDTWMNRDATKTLLADPQVSKVVLAAGVVQKYVSQKHYQKFDGKAGVSGWGLNFNGEAFVSSSNYKLDIIYGFDLVVVHQRDSATAPNLSELPHVPDGGLDKFARTLSEELTTNRKLRRSFLD